MDATFSFVATLSIGCCDRSPADVKVEVDIRVLSVIELLSELVYSRQYQIRFEKSYWIAGHFDFTESCSW